MKGIPSSINIPGFEFLPEGQLLTQFVDFRHSMGAAYERCVGYTKDFHTHDRVNLTFPRSSSVIRFTTTVPDRILDVDDTRFLWMPKNVIHRQDTRTVIYDNLAIFPTNSIVEKAIENFRKRYGKKLKTPTETLIRRRSPLLANLLSSYFAERILEKKRASVLEGLTFQILDELLRILFCPREEKSSTDEKEMASTPISRAIKYIEANLFSALDSKAIAEFSRVSVPTLFRQFKAVTRMTPHKYIFRRRMDEALTLLKRGDHKVGDVALLVGYEDIAAFSKAFTGYFKKSPSCFLGTQ